MAQYIFTMQRLSKIVPPNRTILKDISLSFFPGAKIGVLGLNGSGKSTLLRIMAGIDKEFIGEAIHSPTLKSVIYRKNHNSIPTKMCAAMWKKGYAEIKATVDQFDAINMSFAEPMSDDEMNKLLEEQGELQYEIELAGRLGF